MGQPFCKLADPARYIACAWDLAIDEEARKYWVSFFVEHIKVILALTVEAAVARGEDLAAARTRVDRCLADFTREFEAYAAAPTAHGRVTILTLDIWRDRILREHGIVDAFVDLKARENAKMLPLLRAVCAELDTMEPQPRIRAAVEGIFAGNIFDMGAAATAKRFLGESPDFFNVRKSLPARPWLIDDFDLLASRLLEGRYGKAVFFIDNAGSDFLLGALPFIRMLALSGTSVVIAANERPTLNDMTVHDVRAIWPGIVEVEPSLAELPIRIVSTGTGEPLIDLSDVSGELNAACEDADLVILEGMGRGVESNLDAAFSCDALNVAMLKDVMVAKRHGGQLWDVICQFKRSPANRPT